MYQFSVAEQEALNRIFMSFIEIGIYRKNGTIRMNPNLLNTILHQTYVLIDTPTLLKSIAKNGNQFTVFGMTIILDDTVAHFTVEDK